MSDYSDLTFSWIGEIMSMQGYGPIARQYLRPLIEGGATVKIYSLDGNVPPHRRIDDPFWSVQFKVSEGIPDPPLRVYCCHPGQITPNPRGTNIGATMFELDKYHEQFRPNLSKMKHHISFTRSMQDALKALGFTNSTYCPLPLDLTGLLPKGPVTKVVGTEGDNVVTFMFQADWVSCNNFEELVAAFCVAFSGRKDVGLILKTWVPHDTPEGRKQVEDGLRGLSNRLGGIARPPIVVIVDTLPEEKELSILRGADVYVCPARCNNVDLNTIRAMALEKPVITTLAGSHREYIAEDNSLVVRHTERPVFDSGLPYYDATMYWAAPDMRNLIEALRLAYMKTKDDSIKLLGNNGRRRVLNLFDKDKRTELFAHTIRSIAEDTESDTSK